MPVKSMLKLVVFLLILSAIGLIVYEYSRYYIGPPNLQDTYLPTALHPAVAEKKNQLISQAADKGINVVITQDFRSIEEQDALYEKGRSAEGDIVTHAKGGVLP